MKIQVCGPGCARCNATEKNVIEACAQMNLPAEITHVHDMLKYATLGIRVTPAVVVDGRIVVSGKIPTVEELKKILSGIK
ncbi:MAG: MTH895/ArsE family thioredoxin-like protein [Deltaproteobacteria bacterium]|nr:MTH895/ArsE family thioredoxin-like protein [Deltaproteobacteria bacterium]